MTVQFAAGRTTLNMAFNVEAVNADIGRFIKHNFNGKRTHSRFSKDLAFE